MEINLKERIVEVVSNELPWTREDCLDFADKIMAVLPPQYKKPTPDEISKLKEGDWVLAKVKVIHNHKIYLITTNDPNVEQIFAILSPHPQPEKTYPCSMCGKLRTKDEGGTTFTVCDECWEKTHQKKGIEELVITYSDIPSKVQALAEKTNEVIQVVNKLLEEK